MRALSIAAVAALGLVAACAPTTTASKPAGAALAGAEWVIFEINGQPVIADAKATINFEEGRVFGAGSCNRFMASYTTGTEFDIQLSQMASTMMACMEPAMQQEAKLLRTLEGVKSYSVGADGVLVLTGAEGNSVKARR